MERDVRRVYRVMLAMARKGSFPIFDAEDLDAEMKKFLQQFDPADLRLRKQKREEDITLRVKELSTGRRLPLTIAMKPPDAYRSSLPGANFRQPIKFYAFGC